MSIVQHIVVTPVPGCDLNPIHVTVKPGILVSGLKALVAREYGVAETAVVLKSGKKVYVDKKGVPGGVKEVTVDVVKDDVDYPSIPACCKGSSYDNVRVMRGEMTIRCRNCERKTRACVGRVRQWKCDVFSKTGECSDDCPYLHLNFRKKNLKERIAKHGPSVLTPVARAHQHCVNRDSELISLLEVYGMAPTPKSVSTPSNSVDSLPVDRLPVNDCFRNPASPLSFQESDDDYCSDELAKTNARSIQSIASVSSTYRHDPYNTTASTVELS
eukprot:TRINITY_DN29487_c0_g1_i1.p1 TRINITY_DN29487_c0_g1~~TRINITY_DN29487_c0_g1_i1.p1  ORF type:complete len:272 (+),score=64.11 TRINITY_DN29487_c0_g1_i1:58-873(+)